jgi:hypothetical protein
MLKGRGCIRRTPILKAPTHPSTLQSVASGGAWPSSALFRCLVLGLTSESLKESGVRHTRFYLAYQLLSPPPKFSPLLCIYAKFICFSTFVPRLSTPFPCSQIFPPFCAFTPDLSAFPRFYPAYPLLSPPPKFSPLFPRLRIL